MDAQEMARRGMIFRCLTGSRAHGTSHPGSDLDIRGVYAAPPKEFARPFGMPEHADFPGDEVLFELGKFARMLAQQNPNVLEILWAEPGDVLDEAPAWSLARARRGELLSRRLRASYAGFAADQLKRMRTHARWRDNPQPEAAPLPADFVRVLRSMSAEAEDGCRPPEGAGWAAAPLGQNDFLLIRGGNGSWRARDGQLRPLNAQQVAEAVGAGWPTAAILRFDRSAFETAKRDHAAYWAWLHGRNEARAELEAALGYDPKGAMHAIRLLRTAREALLEGVVRVRRPDAQELLEIRRGEWSLDRVLAEAAAAEASLAEAEAASLLPEELDQDVVSDLAVRMRELAWADARPGRAVAPAGARLPPDLQDRVVVLDIEGTGLGPRQPAVVEVAAVEIVGGARTGRTFHAYCDPGVAPSPYATRLHGLTQGFLAGKPGFAEVWPKLRAFLGDSPVVAHGAASDATMLEDDCDRLGTTRLDRSRYACLARLGALTTGQPKTSLDQLCDSLGIDRSARARGHSAVVDAALAADCLARLALHPGYPGLKDVWLGSARSAELKAAAADRRRAGVVTALELAEGEGTVRFTLADGTELEAAVPEHPRDTHRLLRHPNGALLVVRRDGDGTPENPMGPAVLAPRGGRVLSMWFEGGRPVRDDREADPAAPSPGL